MFALYFRTHFSPRLRNYLIETPLNPNLGIRTENRKRIY